MAVGFVELTEEEAAKARAHSGKRNTWLDAIEALVAGKTIRVPGNTTAIKNFRASFGARHRDYRMFTRTVDADTFVAWAERKEPAA